MNTIQLLNKGIQKLKTKKIRTSQLDRDNPVKNIK